MSDDGAVDPGVRGAPGSGSEDGEDEEAVEDGAAEDADERAHLEDVDDGCGCAEVWERLSDRRRETDAAESE